MWRSRSPTRAGASRRSVCTHLFRKFARSGPERGNGPGHALHLHDSGRRGRRRAARLGRGRRSHRAALHARGFSRTRATARSRPPNPKKCPASSNGIVTSGSGRSGAERESWPSRHLRSRTASLSPRVTRGGGILPEIASAAMRSAAVPELADLRAGGQDSEAVFDALRCRSVRVRFTSRVAGQLALSGLTISFLRHEPNLGRPVGPETLRSPLLDQFSPRQPFPDQPGHDVSPSSASWTATSCPRRSRASGRSPRWPSRPSRQGVPGLAAYLGRLNLDEIPP